MMPRGHAKNPPSVSHRGGLTCVAPASLPKWPHPASRGCHLAQERQVGEGVSPALDAHPDQHAVGGRCKEVRDDLRNVWR
jgi:hypothetical protein